ncbi:nitrate regulatory gene2 protein [Salix suchowensis]|nr:nitrate regulatory gene2 protein [Salix suchowensis]
MGCSPSRIDQLPAVSLCHDRCKFIEEALYQSYALADAHVAYMNSLKSLGPTLHRFFDQTLVNDQSDSQSNGDPEAVAKLSKPSSPDNCPSSSTNSETSHIDFRSDSDDEEFRDNKDFEPLIQSIKISLTHILTITMTITSTITLHGKLLHLRLQAKNRGEDKSGKKREEDRRGVKMKAEKGNDVKQNKVNVVEEKKVESVKEESKDLGQQAKNQSVLEIMKEVEVLFDRAAESGNEVLNILDAGKFRYYYKNSVYTGVSSKTMHTVSPSFLEKNGSVHGAFGEDLGIISVNLSSTLRKLCLWEKKLYDEVKADEHLDEKGADANKVNSTRSLLRMLSTKIKVAIQVIDKISITINKLRDEELWPLISNLIEKVLGMWKVMLECHRCQFQAVVEARNVDVIPSNVKFSEACLEAAIQLKIELQNWNLCFSNWISAQRGYVKALNGWLLRHLPSEPAEMSDDVPPFSPGRRGAPPVFAFCNQWSLAIDRVSEMEVIYAMNGFFASVDQYGERHCVYLQQRLTTDKDVERKMKILEREGQRLQKMMQARGKVYFQASEATHQTKTTNNSSLQLGLKQIFVAIERFSADNMHAYEELHGHVEHSRLSQENPAAPP